MSGVGIRASGGSEVVEEVGRWVGGGGEAGKLSVRSARREAGNGFHANSGVLLEVEDNCCTVEERGGGGGGGKGERKNGRDVRLRQWEREATKLWGPDASAKSNFFLFLIVIYKLKINASRFIYGKIIINK